MTFRLFINVDNDAFTPQPYPEVARLLREIANRLDTVENGDYTDFRKGWTGHYQTIFDSNGNDLGRYAFKAE